MVSKDRSGEHRPLSAKQLADQRFATRSVIGILAFTALLTGSVVVGTYLTTKDETPLQALERLDRMANRDCSNILDPFKGAGQMMCEDEKAAASKAAARIRLSIIHKEIDNR